MLAQDGFRAVKLLNALAALYRGDNAPSFQAAYHRSLWPDNLRAFLTDPSALDRVRDVGPDSQEVRMCMQIS